MPNSEKDTKNSWPVAFVFETESYTVYSLLVSKHQVKTVLQYIHQTSQSTPVWTTAMH